AISTFGDARDLGYVVNQSPMAPVVAMAAAPNGAGYWLVAGDLEPPPPPAVVRTAAAAPAAVVSSGSASSGPASSASSGGGRNLGTFVATCYAIHGGTATGAQTSSETVAVDPSVIPLGSRIFISGIGERIAQDTGGAIQGHRIDIWMPTRSDCIQFGRQDVQVTLG
ncbi:MAG: 3D domain-containing protein, partial [Acidimicrobiales bacterium]